ncbi:MAG: zinc-binding dehydrogenase [Gemmatimonadetes bacterium]|nr:zinc-binding dehydrogenase [Gemmatimonadota bacterium]MCH8935062.1 zinc-binding dehydrogenase [Gemmatimonadota bacterium]
MKAAVLRGANRTLEVMEVPTPSPGPGEVLVRVVGCGMCHTDLHYLDHGVKTFKEPPIILGHEAAGTVEKLGDGSGDVAEGDRVLIPAVLSCGTCRYCRRGRENICDNLVMLGNNMDGAYAEFVVVPASQLIAVPASIPLERASIIADAVSTPYHAVKHRGRVQPGDIVAVVGCGGVGLNVVQCATLAGARVIAIDVNEQRLDIARTLGAVETVNPNEVERIDRHVRKLTDGGVDVAFEAIGNPKTIRVAFSLLRRGGRLCVIGYSADEVTLSAAKLMYFELEVVGSLGCGAGEYPEIIGLVEAGRLRLDIIVSGFIPLDDINDGFDRLRRGEGVRWVVTP